MKEPLTQKVRRLLRVYRLAFGGCPIRIHGVVRKNEVDPADDWQDEFGDKWEIKIWFLARHIFVQLSAGQTKGRDIPFPADSEGAGVGFLTFLVTILADYLCGVPNYEIPQFSRDDLVKIWNNGGQNE